MDWHLKRYEVTVPFTASARYYQLKTIVLSYQLTDVHDSRVSYSEYSLNQPNIGPVFRLPSDSTVLCQEPAHTLEDRLSKSVTTPSINLSYKKSQSCFASAGGVVLAMVPDRHFGSVFFPWYVVFVPLMAVNSSVMCLNIQAMPWLPNMQDQTLLTLCWRSFSECSREWVAFVFARKGCQYRINGCL